MLNRMRKPVLAAADEMLVEPGVEGVILFGELCGGQYPHPDVQPDGSARPVQRGIWYSPRIEFVVFDIAVSMVEGRGVTFLPYSQTVALAEKHGLLYARQERLPCLVASFFDLPHLGRCWQASLDWIAR